MGNGSGWQRQWVWPLDNSKEQRRAGFFGRFRDVITNSGPDIFIQPKGSKKPIKLDRWANWDTYHTSDAAEREQSYGNNGGGFLKGKSRGLERYDPYTRKYVHWDVSENRQGFLGWYPIMMRSEIHGFSQSKNMKGWDSYGPKRFCPEFDGFWQAAHRAGENMSGGRHPHSKSINPNFSMSYTWPYRYQEMYGMTFQDTNYA